LVNEVWAINLGTGDKFTRRRWRDYYNVDADSSPKYGYFDEGSLIGIFLDCDRAIISFYKDGNNLG